MADRQADRQKEAAFHSKPAHSDRRKHAERRHGPNGLQTVSIDHQEEIETHNQILIETDNKIDVDKQHLERKTETACDRRDRRDGWR